MPSICKDMQQLSKRQTLKNVCRKITKLKKSPGAEGRPQNEMQQTANESWQNAEDENDK